MEGHTGGVWIECSIIRNGRDENDPEREMARGTAGKGRNGAKYRHRANRIRKL